MTVIKRFRMALLLALVLAALRGAPALAHAIVTRTDPADGAVLSEAPSQVRLWFSEEVSVSLSKFRVLDSQGRPLPGITHHADDGAPALIVIDLPDLTPGAYRVTWDALSTDDLHITSGSIVFGVQTSADGAAGAGQSGSNTPDPIEVGLRWLDFAALSTLIGALALALLASPDETVTRRLLRLALLAGGAALITGLGGVLVQAIAISSDPNSALPPGGALLQLLTQTAYGTRWLMREVWTLVLLIIVVWQSSQPVIGRLALGATIPLGLALVGLQAMNGHATAFNDDSLVRVISDALHLLGAGVWVGGLIALGVACGPLLRRGPAEAAQARLILRRFGLIAACSLSVLFVTGLYNSGQQIASLDALLFTFYGHTLLIKIALVFAVGGVGLINASLLHPRVADVIRRLLRRPPGWTLIAPRRLRRTLLVEMFGGTAVVLLAAVLGSSTPARGPEFDPPVDTPPQTLSANVNDLFVTFSIKPNRPGQNFISIGVFDTRRPAPAPIERVSAQLIPPDGSTRFSFEAEEIGKGKYQITGNAIGLPGDWGLQVTVYRPGLPDAVWSFPWNVMPVSRLSPRPVVVSNQPLAPVVTAAALLLAVIFSGGLYALLRQEIGAHRTRPPRGAPPDGVDAG